MHLFLDRNKSSNNVKLIIKLKNLARFIRLPIIIITDLPSINHKKNNFFNNRPTLTDLDPIYEYCDTMIFTHRNGYYEEVNFDSKISKKESVEIIIPKQYFNGEGITNLMFNQELGKFINNPLITSNIVKKESVITTPISNDDVPF